MFMHERIKFGYHHARDDRTASEGHQERVGVCRDFAHLAIALCRLDVLAYRLRSRPTALNVPKQRPGMVR